VSSSHQQQKQAAARRSRCVRFLSSKSCEGRQRISLWSSMSSIGTCEARRRTCEARRPAAGDPGVAASGAKVTARPTAARLPSVRPGDGARPGRRRTRGAVPAVEAERGDDGGVSVAAKPTMVEAEVEVDVVEAEDGRAGLSGRSLPLTSARMARRPWRAARLAWAAVVDAGADDTRLKVRVAGARRGEVPGDR
jgi:hypothetical protein